MQNALFQDLATHPGLFTAVGVREATGGRKTDPCRSGLFSSFNEVDGMPGRRARRSEIPRVRDGDRAQSQTAPV